MTAAEQLAAPVEVSKHPEYDQGYADGRAATEAEIAQRGADVLVPVPTPWSLVKVGDVMRAPNGALWMVLSCAESNGQVWPILGSGAGRYPAQGQPPVAVHPDERVPILVPMPEHTALSILREAFGEAHVRRLRVA